MVVNCFSVFVQHQYILEKGEYKQLNLLKVVGKMQKGEIKNIQVYLGEKEKYPTRLVLEKVPTQLANEKRRKLTTDKQNKRKGISKERLIFYLPVSEDCFKE